MSSHFPRRPVFGFLALSLGALTTLPAQSVFKGDLDDRSVVEDRLSSQGHRYRMLLSDNHYVNIRVEQTSVDLRLLFMGPDGSRLAQIDRGGVGRIEQLLALSRTAGVHWLELQPKDGQVGSYRLKVEALRPAGPKDSALVRANQAYRQALSFRRQGTPESTRLSIEKYREALPLWREAVRPRVEASTWNNLGFAYWSLDEPAQAMEAYAEALRLWKRLGDEKGEGDTLINLANALIALGRLREARGRLLRVLDLTRSQSGRVRLRALSTLGTVYQRLGQGRDALRYHLEALELVRKKGNQPGQAAVLNNLGTFYLSVGEAAPAQSHLRQALAFYRKLKRPSIEAKILINLGLSEELLDHPHSAIDLYRLALQLYRELSDKGGQAAALLSLGRVTMRLDGPEALPAEEHLQAALELSGGQDPRIQVGALNSLVKLYLDRGDVAEADRLIRRTLSIPSYLVEPTDRLRIIFNQARLARAQGRPDAARLHFEEALGILESLRNDVPSPELKSAFFARKQGYFERFVEDLMELHRLEPEAGWAESALGIAERARARGLLDFLAESGVDLNAGVDPELLAREREISGRLSRIQKELLSLSPDAEGKRIERLRRDLSASEAERSRVQLEIRQARPARHPLL